MYVTLDGYATFPEYPGSGDPPKGEDRREEETVSYEMWIKHWKSTDTILFGRKTYEQWADFWPRSKRKPSEDKFYHDFSRFLDSAQKIVLSKTLKKTSWENTRIVRGNLAEVVARLKKEQGKDIAFVGGTATAQKFMQMNLIDEYFLAVFPVILGRGPLLFGKLRKQVTMQLVNAKSFKYGELVLHYTRIN